VNPPTLKRRMAVEPFATVPELCARWRTHRSTVGRWIAAKRLAATRVPGGWRIKLSEVERFEKRRLA